MVGNRYICNCVKSVPMPFKEDFSHFLQGSSPLPGGGVRTYWIDCHSHILPGLDDGARDMDESLALCRRLVEWGFGEVVCTCHRQFLYRNEPSAVVRRARQLQRRLDDEGVDLVLHPSMEYRLIPETWPETLRKGWLLPWCGNHVLVELPISNPRKMGDISPVREISALRDAGYTPVLAHPERYHYLEEDGYQALLDAGALFQRNLGSLKGFYGWESARRAKILLDNGSYSLLGTDLHSPGYAASFDGIFVLG